MKNIVIFLLITAFATGCNSSEKAEVQLQIEEQNRKLHKVVQNKDINLLDEVYHPQAYFLAPSDTVVNGIKNIKAKWMSGLKNMSDMQSKTLKITGQGDVVSEIGIVQTTIKTKDTTFIYRAKYNNVWQKDASGKYLLKVDIWNDINGK